MEYENRMTKNLWLKDFAEELNANEISTGNSHREGYCEEGSFLECLRGYSENLDICFLEYFSCSSRETSSEIS